MIDLLTGIRVIEVSTMAFVPSAAVALADWGADVIKVEHPVQGDMMRGSVVQGVAPSDWRDGFTMMWENANRGKRSIGLNLGHRDGRSVLRDLVGTADVFLTNFLPPTLAKLEIGPEVVREWNPRIVYGLGSAYGGQGPMRDRGGFDIVAFWHSSGISYELTPPGADAPTLMPGPGFGDMTSGLHLAGGIVGGLFRRERTGLGATIEVSLLGAGIWSAQSSVVGADLLGTEGMPRPSRADSVNPLGLSYQTADGRFVALAMMHANNFWDGFCEVIDRPDLRADPRLVDMAARAENAEYCIRVLTELFASRPLAEWQQLLGRQRGPWASVQSPRDVLRDEQVIANQYVQAVDYGDGRIANLVASPVRVDGAPPTLRPAPDHGAHTEEVLLELGKSWAELSALKDSGAIL
jgi:crotonobetainyl-CoA:carnitine CoA-transferase CaiB-like acyl-CoA transferase